MSTKQINNFFQCRHNLMLQTDSSAYYNVSKKLKHCSIIIGCWDILWSVHLLFTLWWIFQHVISHNAKGGIFIDSMYDHAIHKQWVWPWIYNGFTVQYITVNIKDMCIPVTYACSTWGSQKLKTTSAMHSELPVLHRHFTLLVLEMICIRH